MILAHVGGLFLQLDVWDLVQSTGPLPKAVLVILVLFSLYSWAVILSKWASFRRARSSNRSFLRAFRKAPALDTIAAASEQFNRSPLVVVFDFGYSEVARQMKSRGSVTNPLSLERTLQLGMSEEITRLERNMSILATAAGVSPFIGRPFAGYVAGHREAARNDLRCVNAIRPDARPIIRSAPDNALALLRRARHGPELPGCKPVEHPRPWSARPRLRAPKDRPLQGPNQRR